jgi:RNA polymerase sigma-70 factor (ECF subfamily)
VSELRDDAATIVQKTLRDLEIRFGRQLAADEREDIAQEAYAKVLAAEEGGSEVRAPLAMVRRSAVNVAIDRLRRSSRKDVALTEAHPAVARTDTDPATVILTRADLARGIEAAEQLPPKQQAVYRATVIDGLSPSDACRRLAMPRSTFFKYRDQAIAHVQSAQLGEAESRFAGGEEKLLSAYALGLANARERARVRRLLRHDPRARVLLRELKRGHELAAGALPALLIVGRVPDPAGVTERVTAAVGRIRDLIQDAAHRTAREAADTAGASAGAAGKGAGAAGAGLIAKLTVGGGGSAAIACLVGGGALVACVATGVLPTPLNTESGDARAPVEHQPSHAAPRPPRVADIADLQQLSEADSADAPSAGGEDHRNRPRRSSRSTADEQSRQSSAESSVVSPSAPVVQQEFGVDAGATPVSGAPPDTNDSDGASAATVRQEFGP